MLITFSCDKCQSVLEIESDAAGSRMACPECGAPLTVPKKGPSPGVTIGGFRIEKLLGKGGMGEVYLARQLSMDRPVALKILPSQLGLQKDLVERFLHEVRLLAKLDHPHVVMAYEAGEDAGVLYLAMAYVAGHSLEDWLKTKGRLSEREALEMLRKMASALAYAWDRHRLLHRDIKPANILLDTQGEPKLADLGLSKSLDEAQTMTVSGTIMGTPNYMSPEQVEGRSDIDTRADMYSLGGTLYHMVTGQVPFAGSSVMETLKKQATESLPDPRQFAPELSEGCVALMEIMLAKKREQRHPNWETVIADIDRVLAGMNPTKAPPAIGESVLLRGIFQKAGTGDSARKGIAGMGKPLGKAPGRSRTLVWIGASAAVVVALAGLVVWLIPRPADKPITGVASEVSQRATASESARAPDVLKQDARLTKLNERYEEAVKYAEDHHGDYAGAIERFDRLKGDAAGTAIEKKATDEIQQLVSLKQKALTSAMDALKADVSILVAQGKYEEALKRLSDYQGAFAGEMASVRQELAQTVQSQARAKADEQVKAQQSEAAKAKLAVLTEAVAANMLGADYTSALRKITDAKKDSALGVISNDLAAIESSVNAAVRLPEILLASFDREKGKEVVVELKNGKSGRLQVVGTRDGKVRVQEPVGGGFVEHAFEVNELSLNDKLKRIGDDKQTATLLLRGLLLYQAGNRAMAEKQFAEAGDGGICGALARAAGSRPPEAQPAKPVGSREEQARAELVNLLKLAGMSPDLADPGKLVEAIGAKIYTSNEVAKIQGAVAAFHKAYGVTETAKTNMPVLEALSAVSTEPALGPLPPVPLKEATEENIQKALSELRASNPGLGKLNEKHEIKPEGITLDLTGNPKLKNIRPLAGLPVRMLNLSDTGVSDIRALAGMPLMYAGLDKTRVKDLGPLAGCPIEQLVLDMTPVSNLKPLSQIRSLRVLWLERTEVTDLAALRGLRLVDLRIGISQVENIEPLSRMPLEFLSMGTTLARDLTPLGTLSELRHLNMGGNQISDLTPLKGLQLESLCITDTRVADISVLSGMPLKSLQLARTGVTDLGPLKDAKLESLNLAETNVRSLKPLAGMPMRLLVIGGCQKMDDLKELPEYFPTLEQINLSPKDAKPEILSRFKNLKCVYVSDGRGNYKEVPLERFQKKP